MIARGDGSPVFLLANVVDDLDEGITQVIRGEEHLSNTPKQQLLWEALGARPPVWAHLPVIVNEKRQKLSKRRDKVALEDYLAEGFLPEAMVNYLMLLGWGPGNDREIRPYEELEQLFRIEDVNTAPAFFDVKKLTAFNGEYIRALSPEQFADACAPWLVAPYAPWAPEAFDRDLFEAAAPLAQTRLALLSEITACVDFLFLDEVGLGRGVVEQGDEGGRRRHPGRRVCRTGRPRGLEVGGSEGRTARCRRAARPQAGQGAGAHPGRGHRPDRRASAVRVHGTARPGARTGPSGRGGR